MSADTTPRPPTPDTTGSPPGSPSPTDAVATYVATDAIARAPSDGPALPGASVNSDASAASGDAAPRSPDAPRSPLPAALSEPWPFVVEPAPPAPQARLDASGPQPAAARISGPIPSVVVHRPGSTHHTSKANRAAPPVHDEGEAAHSSALRERPGQPPWARMALALAVCGPALWLGGVPSAVVPVFIGVVVLLWIRLCVRSPGPLRVPSGSLIGMAAATVTLLQWLPLPLALRQWLAPDLVAMSAAALDGSGATPWPGVSPVPGDSALEAARLLGLTGLYVAAAQLSWRVSAGLVAGLGSLVALIGLAQAGLGVRKIFGFYQPADVDPTLTPALLTSFVNPNHQAGLFLLGIFSAAALAVYYRVQRQQTSDPGRLGRAGERGLVALAAVAIQGVALLLSLSRGAITALLVVAPIALLIAWARDATESRGRLWLRRAALLLVFVGVGGFLARQSGAWAELATLARSAEPGFETKFRVAQDAISLVPLSPVVGIGRGGFLDLFPAVDTHPAGVVHTHLESAPIAMLVEWGPFVGTAIGLGLLWWWIAAMYSSGGRHGRPRRIALCGLLALGIHSLGDFSLEFLGVAAPLCALAGSLSERRMIVRWPARRALRVGTVGLLGALLLAMWALPHTWQRRPRGEVTEQAEPPPVSDLTTRPLDGDLHTRLAFAAVEARDWEEARARALVATRLHPHAADPWWLLTAAEFGLGRAEASADALAHTLAEVRKPLSLEVVNTLLLRYPNAEELATRMPRELAPWTLVMESIIPVAPAYAAILAAARNQVDAQEPEVLRLQVRIALANDNPTLARHHAAMLRQLAPDDLRSHLLFVQALRSFKVPREREIQAALDDTLARGRFTEPGELGMLEEELVTSLLREGTSEGRARARALLPALLTRPGDRGALQRRNALAELAGG